MNINKFQNRIADAFEKNDIRALEKLKKQSFDAIKDAKGRDKAFYIESFKLLSASLLANNLDLHKNFKGRITELNNRIHATVEKTVQTFKHKSMQQLDKEITNRLSKAGMVVPPRNKNEITWTEIPIPGDGDCGFTATNTTREEVVAYLLKNSSDEKIRSLVAPEIKGWLLLKEYNANEIPQTLKKRLNSLKFEIGSTLDKTSLEMDVFEAYVKHYYGVKNKGYLVMPDYTSNTKSTGVMDVIAKMKGTLIRIWKKLPNKPNELYLHSIVGEESKGTTLELIHKGGVKDEGGNHFNRLKGKPRIAKLGSTQHYIPL